MNRLRGLLYDPPDPSKRFRYIMALSPPSNRGPLTERVPEAIPSGLSWTDGWKLEGVVITDEIAEILFIGTAVLKQPGCLEAAMQTHYLQENSPPLVQCLAGELHKYADERSLD